MVTLTWHASKYKVYKCTSGGGVYVPCICLHAKWGLLYMRLRSLLWCLCDVFQMLITSLVCWLYTSSLGLVRFQIVMIWKSPVIFAWSPGCCDHPLTASGWCRMFKSWGIYKHSFLILKASHFSYCKCCKCNVVITSFLTRSRTAFHAKNTEHILFFVFYTAQKTSKKSSNNLSSFYTIAAHWTKKEKNPDFRHTFSIACS